MLDKIGESGSNKATFFELLGGKLQVRALVERFYDIMDSEPKAATIRALHPQDLTGSCEKLFMFLTGWTGGPQLYIERYGHAFFKAQTFTVCHWRIRARSVDVLHDKSNAGNRHRRTGNVET